MVHNHVHLVIEKYPQLVLYHRSTVLPIIILNPSINDDDDDESVCYKYQYFDILRFDLFTWNPRIN